VDALEFKSGLIILLILFLELIQQLIVLLHEVQTLLAQFLYFNVLAVQSSFEAVLLLLDFSQLRVVVL
jgi:hypothetical protein